MNVLNNKDNNSKNRFKNNLFDCIVCISLIVLLFIAYWGVWNYDFINFDDSYYVSKNLYIKKGLTKENILWALSNTYGCWQPMTWISHMMDCELFGVNPGMHHLVNLFLHILNSILLFIVLKKITEKKWESAFIACLFACHPLSVDSVAWIAERKNLLSTLWWILGIWAYSIYAEKPNIYRYLIPLLFFMFGLMTKPISVIMPFTFLILDYWPLNKKWNKCKNTEQATNQLPLGILDRLICIDFYHRIIEKIPYFALIIFYFYFFFITLKEMGTIRTETVPMALRISNVFISYVFYLWKLIWPQNLIIYYPFPNNIPIWQSVGAMLFLIFVTTLVVKNVKHMPYLMIGWFWYLGTLVPVMGLVQTGIWPQIAERWMYVPQIGIYIIFVFGVFRVVTEFHIGIKKVCLIMGALLLALTTATWFQVRHWQNNKTLYEHTINIDPDNKLAHHNYGFELSNTGRAREAIEHFKIVLRLDPDDTKANYSMGAALYTLGKLDEAISVISRGLKSNPNHVESHILIGTILKIQGNKSKAMQHYEKALKIKPKSSEIFIYLGSIYQEQRNYIAAEKCYRAGIRLTPNNSDGYLHLAVMYYKAGEIKKAIDNIKMVIQIDPGNADAYNNLGVFLYEFGNIKESIANFKKSLIINPNHIDAPNNLEKVMKALNGKN